MIIYRTSAVAEMGDRLATIDMDRKVGGCCAHFCGGTAAAHFSAYIGFGPTLPALRHGLMIDENQPVRVETNNFMRVVRLCLIPITGIRDSPSIWLPITVLSLQDLKILLSIFHLLEPHEQFVPELSICTTIIHDFCIPFSTFSSIFSFFFPLYPILIHQILQRAVGRLGMDHTTPRQCLWPVGSVF